MKEGMYVHFTACGWCPVIVNQVGYTSITCLSSERSFASAKIKAQQLASRERVPYLGECECCSCKEIPRKVWSDLKRQTWGYVAGS